MRILISLLLAIAFACVTPVTASAKSGPHKYKFKKPGKYKRPKIQAQKWKPTKEQRKAAAKSPLGRTRK